MADLVTRLLLNSSQFDNNIRRSTQQVQQFQQVGRNITATIGRFAGVLGIAMTAGEAFNKVLNSSQTLGDMTASNMAALKLLWMSSFIAWVVEIYPTFLLVWEI